MLWCFRADVVVWSVSVWRIRLMVRSLVPPRGGQEYFHFYALFGILGILNLCTMCNAPARLWATTFFYVAPIWRLSLIDRDAMHCSSKTKFRLLLHYTLSVASVCSELSTNCLSRLRHVFFSVHDSSYSGTSSLHTAYRTLSNNHQSFEEAERESGLPRLLPFDGGLDHSRVSCRRHVERTTLGGRRKRAFLLCNFCRGTEAFGGVCGGIG